MINDFLNNAVVNFAEYIKKVDEKYAATVKENDLFGKNEVFYREVASVITKFLKDTDNAELFIQIPMLSHLNEDCKRRLLESCLDTIMTASTDKLKFNTELTSDVETAEVGNVYYTSDEIKGPDGKARARLWEIAARRNGDGNYAKEIYPDEQHFGAQEGNRAVNDHKCHTLRLNRVPTLSEFKQLKDKTHKLMLYEKNRCDAQYENILAYGPANIFQSYALHSDILDLPLHFESDSLINCIKSCDVLFVFSDRYYKYNLDHINNAIGRGYLKKVIYVGMSMEDNFEGYDRATYSFTFREMFHYFHRKPYPKVLFDYVKDEWLENFINDLKCFLINDVQVEPGDENYIALYAAYCRMGLTNEDFKKSYMKIYLENNYNIVDDDIKRIVDYCEAKIKECPKGNAKECAFKQIQSHKAITWLMPPESRKRKSFINNIIREGNSEGNAVVIDALLNKSIYVDMVKDLFNSGISCELHILSYLPMNILEKFFKREADAYNGKYRLEIIGIKYNDFASGEDMHSKDLMDYANILTNMFDTYKIQSPNNQTQYKLNNLELSSGDVLLDIDGELVQENIAQVKKRLEDSGEQLPADALIYIKPDNFSHLMEIYYNFREGKNVSTYADLWKTQLRKAYNDCTGKDKAKCLCEAMKIKKSSGINLIERVADNQYDSLFTNNTPNICKYLQDKNYITADESKAILTSRTIVNRNSDMGGILKNELFSYKLTMTKGKVLSQIERNAALRKEDGINADTIMRASLKRIKIESIEKL